MKNKTIVLMIFLLFAFSSNSYSFSMSRYTAKYIPIDSITQNDCLHYVCIDLKNKQINLMLDNQEMMFEQTQFGLDSVLFFRNQMLFYYLDSVYYYTLEIGELQSFSNDSIFVSAVWQKFHSTKGNAGKAYKIKSLSIAKSELSGLLVSVPTAKQIKREQSRYVVGVIILSFFILISSIITN
jgi:hypothetical protein